MESSQYDMKGTMILDDPQAKTEADEAKEMIKKLISARVTSFNGYRQQHLIDIKANIAYLAGHQNIMVENNQIVNLPKEYEIETTTNLILPAVMNDVAVSTKVAPSYDIVPASSDENDKTTAIACQKLLPYLKRINKKDLHRGAVVLWYDLDGCGWRKVYWDTHHHVSGVVEQEEAEQTGQQVGTPKYEGETIVDHVPNTEVIYDHRVKDLSKLGWIIHHKQVTRSWIRNRYGEEFLQTISKGKFKKLSEDVSEYELTINRDFSNLMGGYSSNTSSDEDLKYREMLDDDMVTDCYEYWSKPDFSMPTGALALLIGGEVALHRPYPLEQYPHGELPLIPCVPLPMTGIAPTSISRITQARPLQREYNKLRSLILNNIDVQGNSIIMAPKTAHVEWDKIDNGSGNILVYEGPMKPSRESGTPIPNSLFMHIQETKRGIEEIFAFHEPSKGVRPVGVDSAKGLQALQDADFAQLGPILDALEESDQMVVYQMLTISTVNYGNKMFNIVGDDESWTIANIDTQDLQGKINVVVQRGSSTPTNKAQQSQEAFQVWSSGLLGDPQDVDNRLFVLKQMQLGGIENVLKKNAKDIAFANKEFYSSEAVVQQMPQISLGASNEEIEQIFKQYIFVPPVNPFDDHMVHLREHRNFMLDKYWKYKETGAPQYQILLQAYNEHINMHTMAIQESQMMQQQVQLQSAAFEKGNTMEQLSIKHHPFDKGNTIEQLKIKHADRKDPPK